MHLRREIEICKFSSSPLFKGLILTPPIRSKGWLLETFPIVWKLEDVNPYNGIPGIGFIAAEASLVGLCSLNQLGLDGMLGWMSRSKVRYFRRCYALRELKSRRSLETSSRGVPIIGHQVPELPPQSMFHDHGVRLPQSSYVSIRASTTGNAIKGARIATNSIITHFLSLDLSHLFCSVYSYLCTPLTLNVLSSSSLPPLQSSHSRRVTSAQLVDGHEWASFLPPSSHVVDLAHPCSLLPLTSSLIAFSASFTFDELADNFPGRLSGACRMTTNKVNSTARLYR